MTRVERIIWGETQTHWNQLCSIYSVHHVCPGSRFCCRNVVRAQTAQHPLLCIHAQQCLPRQRPMKCGRISSLDPLQHLLVLLTTWRVTDVPLPIWLGLEGSSTAVLHQHQSCLRWRRNKAPTRWLFCIWKMKAKVKKWLCLYGAVLAGCWRKDIQKQRGETVRINGVLRRILR